MEKIMERETKQIEINQLLETLCSQKRDKDSIDYLRHHLTDEELAVMQRLDEEDPAVTEEDLKIFRESLQK